MRMIVVTGKVCCSCQIASTSHVLSVIIIMFFTTFLWSQLFVTPPYPTKDFTGKTVIVTGSNTGLGLEAARHIARLDCAKLILAVRNTSKGEAAKESILADQQITRDIIEVWELDLSNNASVKAFAERVNSLDRVDAVVENAGVLEESFKLAEGFEQVIKVNVIATFLLALLLLPKLRETSQKYAVKTNLEIVTSEVHHMTIVPEAEHEDIFQVLNDRDSKYDGQERYVKTRIRHLPRNADKAVRYQVSKAMEILFVRELVKKTQSTPTITLVNPGLCWSEFQRNLTSPVQVAFITALRYILARTAEVGSRTLVAGISAGRESHGKYMADSEHQEVADWVRSARGEEVQKKVYAQTLAVLESIEPGISKNI